jgi:hypothetical protein
MNMDKDLATLRRWAKGQTVTTPASEALARVEARFREAEAELSRLREERDEATMKVLLETRHPSDQVKIDEWWAARSEVKIDGNSRAAYVLQRDVAWERAEAAEARLGEAHRECARLQQALERISAAPTTPLSYRQPGWNTSRMDAYMRHLADEALAGPGSEQSSLTESGLAGLPDTPADSQEGE